MADNSKCKEFDLRVYSVEDRIALASILFKNGYTVSNVKVLEDGKKSPEYCVHVVDDSANLRAK